MSKLTIRLAAGAAAVALPLALTVPAAAAPAAASAGLTAEAAASQQIAAPAKDRKGKRVRPTADISTGPSVWKGWKLRHPRGGRFYPAVRRWANLVLAVMREKGIKKRFLPGILAQIQQESSGNPYAVNRWDSNARAGHPSKGLLQIIAPTYRAYAKSGFRNLRYQTVPYTNIWASLDYVLDRYGKSKFRKWNRGYNQGY